MPIGSDVVYLDASALVKLVLEEPESAALRESLRTLRRRVSSRIALVEVVRTVRRRHPAAHDLALRLFRGLTLLEDDDRVLAAAALSEPEELRALDAIHVASALRLARSLTAFVSYDARQLGAAEALGLPVLSPR